MLQHSQSSCSSQVPALTCFTFTGLVQTGAAQHYLGAVPAVPQDTPHSTPDSAWPRPWAELEPKDRLCPGKFRLSLKRDCIFSLLLTAHTCLLFWLSRLHICSSSQVSFRDHSPKLILVFHSSWLELEEQ